MIQTSSFDNKVQLQCTVTGNPRPVVFWQKMNSEGQFVRLPETGRWPLNRSKSVIEVEYGATYRCVANNSLGINDDEYTLPIGGL